ncbi:NAD dependent epimerase/dehydratase family protein [Nocardia nova SH22a]|uniref:NAD dependent epimerase/dehydratase family protein n=1 Tax=Nocardia nova SH22a TaxID=1415166 RepID=W5TME2_9NOCA|nr:NAD-dependent epimerase/dehydratase family protein [Nocardia nova]AHH18381.1 NAD dependent epimerase/dehydratase family protein [Nocardia nova SH22a]
MSIQNLVIGASGFLGSHVAGLLVARGERVRVMVRETSSRRALEGLNVEYVVGELEDRQALRTAMAGCEVVYYCVVDARPWLRDPAPLFHTNVAALNTVLEVAAKAELRRFVFTSSVATLPIGDEVIDEDSGPHNWTHLGGAYVRSRVEAEESVLRYAREHNLPAVAMCVANTYGPGDYLPTPHGAFVAAAAHGKMPVYVRGAGAEVVDIRDAALALVLAGEHGSAGHRYIVSAGWRNTRELHDFAARVAGAAPARYGLFPAMLSVAGLVGEVVARWTGKDVRVTRTTMRLMHTMTPLDHSKAERDLGWRPRPIEDTITDAVKFFTTRRRRADTPASSAGPRPHRSE